MSRTFKVDLQTTANLRVKIVFDDTEVDELERELKEANGHEYTVDMLTQALKERADDRAPDEHDFSGPCIHCSGMGLGANFTLDLDDWREPTRYVAAKSVPLDERVEEVDE